MPCSNFWITKRAAMFWFSILKCVYYTTKGFDLSKIMITLKLIATFFSPLWKIGDMNSPGSDVVFSTTPAVNKYSISLLICCSVLSGSSVLSYGAFVLTDNSRWQPRTNLNIKCQDYVYVKGGYQNTMLKKHYVWHEHKVNENKVSSYCEALRYL